MAQRWLDRVFGKGGSQQRAPGRRSPLPRIWTVRPVHGSPTALQPGMQLRVRATEGVRFGHLCLLAEVGHHAAALAAVLGEPPGRGKRQAYIREAVITNVFAEPLRLPEPLGRKIAAPVEEEYWTEVGTHVQPSEWEFIVSASRHLNLDEYKGQETLEKAAEQFMVELLKERGGIAPVGRQVLLPGSSDPGNRRRADHKVDVLCCWNADGRRHFLVIEGKWINVGGSQAAAQAYEYARRIKTPGERAAGRTVFDLDVSDVQDDVVHAVVVANVVPEHSDAGEKLGVPRMSYVEFVQLLGRRAHLALPAIDDGAKT